MTLQSNNYLVKSVWQEEREIIFIDATVEDYQSLIAGINPDTKVVILNQMKDGISQITDNLQGGKYKAVHIVSHGGEGSLQLGSKQLNSGNLDIYKSQLQQWRNYLTDDADILLYGCDVAAGKTGVGFVQQLSQLTGADVAASDDLTGNAALGGDWDLEVKTGKIESNVAFTPEVRNSYRSILPSIYINEILFNPPGADSPNEYIELRGTPGTTIPTGTYLVGIEGDSGSFNPGDVQNIFDLSGKTFGSNGFLVLLQKSNTYSVNSSANKLTNSGTGNGWGNGGTSSISHNGDSQTEIENASASFLLIQTGFAPSLNDDIDSNDDGTPDAGVYSSWTVLDSVAVLDGSSATDRAYGSIVFRKGTNGTAQSGATVVNTSFEAGYVGRWGDSTGSEATDWVAAVDNFGGSAPNWTLGTGSNSPSPGVFAGQALNHIGATNFTAIPRNTAPTLDNTGNPTLTAINEDISDSANVGTRVTDLISGLITDADGDPKAIAITGVNNTNGKWQLSTNGGTTWTDFGTVSDNSAVVLGAIPLYTDRLGTAPASQNWLSFTNVSGANQTLTPNGTNLNTTANNSIYAGYSNYTASTLVNSNFPTLNRTSGYSLSFNMGLVAESRTNSDRAGFSVIAISSDGTKGIELGFQQLSLTGGNIFAQGDGITANPGGQTNSLFKAAENVSFNTNLATNYTLSVQGDSYHLFANGTDILTGPLRDYTRFTGSIDPYETRNFIFLGDDTTSASGTFNLKQVVLQTDTRVRFVPNANYNGTSDITFRAWDTTNGTANGTTGVNASNNGGTSSFSNTSAKATITVNPVNDAPVVQANKTITLNEDASNTPLNITAPTDVDGDSLTITVTGLSDASKGKVYLADRATEVINNQKLTATELTGLVFSPVADANGSAGTFSYSANDGKVNSSQSITLNINPVNDRPIFTIGGNQSVKTGTGQQAIALWASGFYAGAANESGQKVAEYIVEVISNSGVVQGTPTINLAGDFIYTPSAIGTAEFRVKVRDDGGTANGGFDTSISTTQTFKITVNPTATNSINGTPNPDNLTGTDQSDRISGLDNNDTIYGGLGSDRIFGNNGNDTLYGDLGIKSDNSDIQPVYGLTFSMDDTIAGGAGSDKIYGNLGNDKLYGDEGDDFIWGGEGNDEIWGGYDNDTLSGGAGKDAFVLVRGQKADMIMDFTTEDVLGCAGALRYSSLIFTKQNGDTLITDKSTNELLATLKGFIGSANNGGLF
ncbi:DUF4347 domain-containing protein [Plectonema radiosum NIES-515]|uniref:DUF4347 domain-containing protein n=1 Tax=Plectonema radiosum NIES-515 TaxID=2986073 RepID=A0ABT3ATS9_9CYAN|nr:DUF4347 domain-containing protein [Plectonema radiosum]MCV3212537.1 DUF4347 domain-containing protein [Plectonema radiosum NIES-515]